MKALSGLVILCFLVTIIHASNVFRIIGGSNAPYGKYPYAVILKYEFRHYCAGSIINKRWILTACHCVTRKDVRSVSVLAGITSILDDVPEIYKATYMIGHEKFSALKRVNDIGLIRVDRNIKFNDKIQPVRLPTSDFYKVGYPVTAIGWGRDEVEGAHPSNLQEITLKIFDQETCHNMWKKNYDITRTQICTFTKEGEGTCKGDSGSALVINHTQIGIVSLGDPCATGMPDVYTRVYPFLDWIESKFAIFND